MYLNALWWKDLSLFYLSFMSQIMLYVLVKYCGTLPLHRRSLRAFYWYIFLWTTLKTCSIFLCAIYMLWYFHTVMFGTIVVHRSAGIIVMTALISPIILEVASMAAFSDTSDSSDIVTMTFPSQCLRLNSPCWYPNEVIAIWTMTRFYAINKPKWVSVSVPFYVWQYLFEMKIFNFDFENKTIFQNSSHFSFIYHTFI